VTWPSGKSKSDTSSFSDEIEHFHSIVVHEQPSSTTTASDSSLHVHADNGNVLHYGVNDHDHTPRVTDVTQLSSHSHSHYSVPQDTSSRFQSRVKTDDGDMESFLNPAATPFLPVQSAEVTDNSNRTDEFLEHINLLYDVTVSSTILTHEVDAQFSETLHRHKTIFASCSSDFGNCPVLEHNIDRGNYHQLNSPQCDRHFQRVMHEIDITDDVLKAGVIETSNSECITATDKRQIVHVDCIQPGNLTPGISSDQKSVTITQAVKAPVSTLQDAECQSTSRGLMSN